MAKIAVFDMNETTLDLAPVRVEVDALVGPEGGFRVWFQRLLQLSMSTTAAGYYLDFTTLARHSLEAVAATGTSELPGDAWDRVASAMGSIQPYPDVPDGLARLRHGGWTLIALTNSAQASVDGQLERSGLRPMFTHVVSVEAVKTFKPAAAPYRHVAELTATEPSDMWMVACHDWDLAGAAAVGMSTAYVARPGMSYAESYPPAGAVVEHFGQLADVLLASS